MNRCISCSHPVKDQSPPFGEFVVYVCETCEDDHDTGDGVSVVPRAEGGAPL